MLGYILEWPATSILDIITQGTKIDEETDLDFKDPSKHAKYRYLKYCAAMHPLPSVRKGLTARHKSCSKDYYELRLSIEQNRPPPANSWVGVDFENCIPQHATQGDSTICDFLTPVLRSDAHFEHRINGRPSN